eukprot:COSAG06_NODE_41602_length_389_cov_1.786207_1_plen_57_part_00
MPYGAMRRVLHTRDADKKNWGQLQVTDDAELKTRLRREQELVLSNAVGPIAADEPM